MDITIYQSPGACSRVTLSALEEIGAPYSVETVNLRANAQQSIGYLALNPKGKVPAIAFDGRVMTENAAILYALHQGNPGARLLPTSDETPAAFAGLSDLVWCASTLHPIVRQVVAPHKWTAEDPSGVAKDGVAKMAKECARISRRLEAQPWWYGQHWSIVDVYLYWIYSTANKGAFALEDFPVLEAHAERVRARPSFQRALAIEVNSVTRHGIDIPIDRL